VESNYVKVQWYEPFTGGYPITAYTVKIRFFDGISYTQDLTNCNGASSTVITT